MPTLLIVHHTTSPSLHAMYGAVHDGATSPEIEGVEVVGEPSRDDLDACWELGAALAATLTM